MNYADLLSDLCVLHESAQQSAARAVDRHLVLRNWLYGAYIVQFEQNGENRAAYGTRLLENLASDLSARGIKGLGTSMLRLTRRFCEVYPQIRQPAVAESTLVSGLHIQQPLVAELAVPEKSPSAMGLSAPRLPLPLPAAKVLEFSWTHLIELIRIDDPWKRAFYENECLKGNWSKRQLQRQIGSLLFDRTALSTDKQAVINQARQQAQEAPSLIGLILCTDKKETRVSYATAGLDRQLFVSRYLNVLPAEETLQRIVEQDAAAWQQQRETGSQSD